VEASNTYNKQLPTSRKNVKIPNKVTENFKVRVGNKYIENGHISNNCVSLNEL
jgi:hypothetical protein